MIFLGFDSLNTIISTEKIESSEPCWDGYQVNKQIRFEEEKKQS